MFCSFLFLCKIPERCGLVGSRLRCLANVYGVPNDRTGPNHSPSRLAPLAYVGQRDIVGGLDRDLGRHFGVARREHEVELRVRRLELVDLSKKSSVLRLKRIRRGWHPV